MDALKSWQSSILTMSINVMYAIAPITSSYCEVCGIQGHFVHDCSYSQPIQMEHTNVFQQRPLHNIYSNTLNLGCKDHPNLSYHSNIVYNFQPMPQAFCQ